MELAEVMNTHYALPVGIVLICAVLVFAFGFKSVEEPPFSQLSNITADDRKASGKKRKSKEKEKKVSQTIVQSTQLLTPKQSSKSDKKSDQKDKNKVEVTVKVSVSVKNKQHEHKKNKNIPKIEKISALIEEAKHISGEQKPEGFDDGDWVEAGSKKDKKVRKKDAGTDDEGVSYDMKDEEPIPTPVEVVKEKRVKKKEEAVKQQVTPTPSPKAVPKLEDVISILAAQGDNKSVEKAMAEALAEEPLSEVLEVKEVKEKIKKEKKKPKVEKETEVSQVPVHPPSEDVDAASLESITDASSSGSSKGTEGTQESFEIISPKENIAFDELGDTWEIGRAHV